MRAIRHSRERSVENSPFPRIGEARELMLRSVLIVVGGGLRAATTEDKLAVPRVEGFTHQRPRGSATEGLSIAGECVHMRNL